MINTKNSSKKELRNIMIKDKFIKHQTKCEMIMP